VTGNKSAVPSDHILLGNARSSLKTLNSCVDWCIWCFADGSLMYERVPNKPEAEKVSLNYVAPHLKRRAYDEVNGLDGKYRRLDHDK